MRRQPGMTRASDRWLSFLALALLILLASIAVIVAKVWRPGVSARVTEVTVEGPAREGSPGGYEITSAERVGPAGHAPESKARIGTNRPAPHERLPGPHGSGHAGQPPSVQAAPSTNLQPGVAARLLSGTPSLDDCAGQTGGTGGCK